MERGPGQEAGVGTRDQIQLNRFAVQALDGHANGNATISLRKNGPSRVSAGFENFDLGGLITVLSGRAVPIASKATGNAELAFAGPDLTTAPGTLNAPLKGETPALTHPPPLSRDLA